MISIDCECSLKLLMECIKKAVSTLKISHWNINGISDNSSELKQHMRDHDVDIMLLNETKLNSKRIVKVIGYNCIRKDRNEKGTDGGVMIYIKKGIKCHEVPVDSKTIEAVAIKLDDKTVIVSAYKAPGTKLDVNDLNLIFKTGKKVLLYGDFTAKNSAWNCRNNNASGRVIFDFANKHLYTILYPDNFTLYPYNDTFPSTIDIGISKNINCDIIVDAINELNSDHLPVLIILNNAVQLAIETRTFSITKKLMGRNSGKS